MDTGERTNTTIYNSHVRVDYSKSDTKMNKKLEIETYVRLSTVHTASLYIFVQPLLLVDKGILASTRNTNEMDEIEKAENVLRIDIYA